MLPRFAGHFDDLVEFGEGLLDRVQPVQDRAGQQRMVRIEVTRQSFGQGRDLDTHLAHRELRQDPRISLTVNHAAGIARAETLVRLDATADSLMLASSSINSKRMASRVRSPISCTR